MLLSSPTDLRAVQTALLPAVKTAGFEFELPAHLEAGEPPEARGLRRDQVRLMVTSYLTGHVEHTRFTSLGDYLRAGDVLVVNTSGTLNAALPAVAGTGAQLELHLSTHLPGDLWVVELRKPAPTGSEPYLAASAGESYSLPGGGEVTLLLPYRSDLRVSKQRYFGEDPGRIRLWLSHLDIPTALEGYLEEYGHPIRYKYVRDEWPPAYYQTVYTTEKGSAEMPSAGRAFTAELITRLVASGVQVAPLLLHTGVASLEEHEPPYEEYYRVPAGTARAVNQARQDGRRVIAVGTTSVRALESVTGEDGIVHPGDGWTELIITPQRGLRAVEGLLTGFHEPKSSHLAMLAALAGYEHLELAYCEALHDGYLWHEFGDLHLILPGEPL